MREEIVKRILATTMILAAGAYAVPAMAGSSYMVGNVRIQADQNMDNATLSISGPDGFYQEQRSTPGAAVMISGDQGVMADGTYTWQITGQSSTRIVTAKNSMNNGRGEAERGFSYETVVQTGSFTIKNGSRVDSTLTEK